MRAVFHFKHVPCSRDGRFMPLVPYRSRQISIQINWKRAPTLSVKYGKPPLHKKLGDFILHETMN